MPHLAARRQPGPAFLRVGRTVMRPADFDVCACGDYRHQHDADGGDCHICTPQDGMNGGKCFMFRLSQRVVWYPAAARECA